MEHLSRNRNQDIAIAIATAMHVKDLVKGPGELTKRRQKRRMKQNRTISVRDRNDRFLSCVTIVDEI